MPSLEDAARKLSEAETGGLDGKFEDVDSIETDATVKESFLSREVEKVEPGTVAGVDGGLLKKRYSAGDVIVTRAVAAVFSFREGGLEDTGYLPAPSPEPEFHVPPVGDAESLDRRADAERIDAEVSVALKAVETADTVFMDGSLVPGYAVPGDVAELYTRLFEEVEEGCLVGVVEDSYGLKLASVLESRLGLDIGKVRDTVIADHLLEERERTFVRRYSSSPVEHPVLGKLEDRHVNLLNTFYVKLSSKDIPLRIDYYGGEEHADRIAGLLLALKSSETYTVPSPVLEADKRAKISEEYLKRLERRFDPARVRRDRRAF